MRKSGYPTSKPANIPLATDIHAGLNLRGNGRTDASRRTAADKTHPESLRARLNLPLSTERCCNVSGCCNVFLLLVAPWLLLLVAVLTDLSVSSPPSSGRGRDSSSPTSFHAVRLCRGVRWPETSRPLQIRDRTTLDKSLHPNASPAYCFHCPTDMTTSATTTMKPFGPFNAAALFNLKGWVAVGKCAHV